ncbi:uncharacterized protein DUF4836 [Sediminitomix flava]|uniref:Uncharacterized protein DUF4836 n=1 Tax=Sediminitomix flava TaxID=379075 RepID=A0A315YVR5_SEDFL|nr:uncharacterized protein DUF4836 [Sediminitomix flava]
MIYRLFSIFCITLITFSCSPDQGLLKVIPKDALFVVSMNTPSLIQKSEIYDSDQYQIANFFVQEFGQHPLGNTLESPQDIGINVFENLYAYGIKNTITGTPFLCFTAELDKTAFLEEKVATFLQHSYSEKVNDWDVIYNGQWGIAWNDAQVLVVRSEHPTISIDIKHTLEQLTSLEDTESHYNSEDFITKLNEKADLGIWLNINQAKSLPLLSEYSYLIPKLRQDDNNIHFNVNFEKDQINTDIAILLSEEDKEAVLGSYFKKTSNTKALQNVPEDALFVVNTAVEPKPYYNHLKESVSQVDSVKAAQIDFFERFWLGYKAKVSTDEFLEALGGELTIAVTGEQKLIGRHNKISYQPKFLAETSMNDLKLFNNFLKKIPYLRRSKSGNYYEWNFLSWNFYLGMHKGIASFSNDREAMNTVDNEGLEKSILDGAYGSYFSSSPFTIYLDLNVNNYPASLKDNLTKNFSNYIPNYEAHTSVFDKMIMYKDGEDQKVKVSLHSEGENSLHFLLKHLDKVYSEQLIL